MSSRSVAGLTTLFRQSSFFVFKSPAPPLRCLPLSHARHIRTRASDRRRNAQTERYARRQEEEEEEDEEDAEDEDLFEDPELDGDEGEQDNDPLSYNTFLREDAEQSIKRRKTGHGGKTLDTVGRSRPTDGRRQSTPTRAADPDINYYEQDEGAPDSTRRRTKGMNADQEIANLVDEKALDEEIDELEKDKERLEKEEEEGLSAEEKEEKEWEEFEAIMDEPNDSDDEDLTEEEINEIKELVAEDEKNRIPPEHRNLFTEEEKENIQKAFAEALPETFDLETLPHHVRPKEQLSPSATLFLKRFNHALDEASGDPNETMQVNLWRYYERGKIYVPGLIHMLPKEAWDLMWASQSEDSPENHNRATHLKVLSQDMAKAGMALTEDQRFARLEALFLDGNYDDALAQWEAGLKQGDAGNAQYLEMGIRMYAYHRNLKRAEDLVDVLFKLHTGYDPRILLQVVEASISLNNEEGFERAWNLYRKLREVLTSDIRMEDFDTISLDFLKYGQKDYALAVFRDMMIVGEQRRENAGFRGTLNRIKNFMSSSDSAGQVNDLGLDMLKYIPRQFQNKWFYASWIRKLIAMGEVDAAAGVMDLMYERGVRPDAKHVTGMISGWFRSTDKMAHRHAERMAWAMIQARLNFVAERRAKTQHGMNKPATPESIHNVESALQAEREKPAIPTIDSKRPIPPASVETFCVMVQWYLRRGMFSNVRHLRNLLVSAELPMNSFFMNHLLFGERRNSSYRDVWSRYQVMSRNVRPDIETWSCLWECMKQHVDPASNRDPRGFPRSRHLFRMMRDWRYSLKGQERRDMMVEPKIGLYNDVIRSFCLSRDVAGSFAAVHELHEMFGVTPDQKTMRMLVMQIAKLGLYAPRTHYQARRLTASKQNQENIDQTTQVLDMIVSYRAQSYEENGFGMDLFSEQQRGLEAHRVALQLLYTVIKQMHEPQGQEDGDDEGNEVDITPIIEQAVKDIGAEPIDVEESMVLVV